VQSLSFAGPDRDPWSFPAAKRGSQPRRSRWGGSPPPQVGGSDHHPADTRRQRQQLARTAIATRAMSSAASCRSNSASDVPAWCFSGFSVGSPAKKTGGQQLDKDEEAQVDPRQLRSVLEERHRKGHQAVPSLATGTCINIRDTCGQVMPLPSSYPPQGGARNAG
jgi:hypothetical protein